jgi:hypothetical protein
MPTLGEARRQVTSQPVPQLVIDYIASQSDDQTEGEP